MSTTLTQKGQVTIPKEIRDLMGLKTGQKLVFELAGSQVVLKKEVDAKESSKLSRWRGLGKKRLKGFSSVEHYLALARGR